MLYVGIDLHLKQLTVCAVCVRNEQGNVVLRRQVSTRAEKIAEFLAELREDPDGYVTLPARPCATAGSTESLAPH